MALERVSAFLGTLVALVAIVGALAVAPAADAAATHVGTARYDAALGAIVVPFGGPVPGYTHAEMSPSHHYFDLLGAALTVQMLQRPGLGGELTRLELADHPERDAVRVVFQGKSPLHPVIRVDRTNHRLLIFPQARGASRAIASAPRPRPTPRPTPKPTPKPTPTPKAPVTAIARPVLRSPGVLWVPTRGAQPKWHAYGSASDSRVVYVRFTHAVIGFSGPRDGRLSDPAIAHWSVSRDSSDTLRLTVRYTAPPRLQIEATAAGLRLGAAVSATAPVATPTPRPTPVATPRPAVQIPMPAATFRPVPVARATARAAEAPVMSPLPVVSPRPLPTARPTPPPVITTHFARPYFDPERQALVCPYVGAAPGYRLVATGDLVTVEVPTSALQTPGRVERTVTTPALLQRWTARDDGGRLALALSLGRAGTAIVALDQPRRQLLVFPQPAGSSGAPMPIRTVFGRVGYDASAGAMVLTYFGQAPSYTVDARSPELVAVDFLGTAIEPSGAQFERVTGMPLMGFWLVAPRLPDVVRLSLRLRYGGHVRVQDDAQNHRLLVVPQLGPEPSPTP